jgi:hypothetical protein
MKVFISWSGLRSQAVAQKLRIWLRDVIQALDPWISVEDIDKGQRWGLVMAERLESTHAGVICLTPENLTAPWLLFEAGALSKLHREAKVCTYLIDMPYTAVPQGPFSELRSDDRSARKCPLDMDFRDCRGCLSRHGGPQRRATATVAPRCVV